MTTRFIYVTDLHGWVGGYEAVLGEAVKRNATAIVSGGDFLPKGSHMMSAQKRFIKRFLPDYLGRCEQAGPRYLGMFGNDDLANRLPYWPCSLATPWPDCGRPTALCES